MGNPSVVKKFKKTLFPLLSDIGFKQFSNKKYGRIRGGILQFLIIHVETRLKREFTFEFGAMILAVPREFFSLSPGGKFPDGKIGKWYRASTDASLEKSIELVKKDLHNLIYWYESSSTPDGFLSIYEEFLANNQHLLHNGHTMLDFGCAYLLKGSTKQATDYIKKAISDYDNTFKEKPTCEWAKVKSAECQYLLDSISNGMLDNILAQRTAYSIEHLKVSKLISKNNK